MSTNKPRRLVYGPAEYAGHEGIIVDADRAELFGRAQHAPTLGDYARDVLLTSWDDFLADEGDADLVDTPSPEDPFDYSEWVNDAMAYPPDTAWDTAARRVAQLVDTHHDELDKIRSGGGSPGGNMDAITGPLDQLALLATLIDPDRDGFTIERDDKLVDLGMSRILFG